MNAEIVSVGTELLLGQIMDTHAPAMARILAECGIGCARRTTIGDNLDRIVGVLREALGRADIVVTIGGLGPTSDDLTRDAIAAALGDELVHEPKVEEELRAFFAKRNVRYAEVNSRQAMRPASARLIDNPNGTAPGLLCEKGGKVVIALPGPKGEFVPMAEGPVREFLSHAQGEGTIHSRVLRVIGMGESLVEEALSDLMQAENPTVAPYAHTGEVHLRLTARARNRGEAETMLDPVEAEVRDRLGDKVYGTDSTTLEESILALLASHGATLSVAESMTGGQVAARFTAVAGASASFAGGVVAYSPRLKSMLLGVSEGTLESHGPVSEAVAAEMAEGARNRFGTDWALSVTGNAGPTSDMGEQPVGLTYVACAGRHGTVVQEHRFRGLREDIQRRASQVALALLRDNLLASGV